MPDFSKTPSAEFVTPSTRINKFSRRCPELHHRRRQACIQPQRSQACTTFRQVLTVAAKRIGILEFGGAINSGDLAIYFRSLGLPVSDVTPIDIGGFSNRSNLGDDSQVMMDIEIAGSVAPRARIRVYFAPFTVAGFSDAAKQAEADRASVLFTGWGRPESDWKDEEINEINASFENASESGITILATAGDRGVTDGVRDGRRHVDFSASSPWVLSVGGTTLKASGGRTLSEVAWKNSSGNFATVGGDSAAVPLWAGLITLIDQGLGYNTGYLNPRLYHDIGPAGTLRSVTSGSNGVDGMKGYSAGPGWTPVTGWGSPDGTKLLMWLRMHPGPGHDVPSGEIPCRSSSK
jgi:kumamolisin